MKKRSLKLIVGALVVTMVGGAFVGCGSKEESTTEEKSINYKWFISIITTNGKIS